ncbi:hypothetical protein [Streptomyces sp. NPDC004783]
MAKAQKQFAAVAKALEMPARSKATRSAAEEQLDLFTEDPTP